MQAAAISADKRQAAREMLAALRGRGLDLLTGVADSIIASLIEELYRERGGYIPAVREDQAVGLAAGAYLAGRWPAVLMQNSGLGYCLNPLTSLNLIYRIPTLLIVGWRGYQGKDAPEHLVMGAHCRTLVEKIGIPSWTPDSAGLVQAVEEADQAMRRDRIPAAIFIRPGIL